MKARLDDFGEEPDQRSVKHRTPGRVLRGPLLAGAVAGAVARVLCVWCRELGRELRTELISDLDVLFDEPQDEHDFFPTRRRFPFPDERADLLCIFLLFKHMPARQAA